MLISHIRLKNWRNFRNLDIHLREVSFVLGPNASGKSNLLDAFRFLRDISKSKGGGPSSGGCGARRHYQAPLPTCQKGSRSTRRCSA